MSGPPHWQRISMRYDADEDRFCLSGATREGEVQAIWLTQRLLRQILPHLFTWLDSSLPRTGVSASPAAGKTVQAFSQAAAVAVRRPAPPVAFPPPGELWLVRGIGLKAFTHELRLTFSSAPRGAGAAVVLPLGATALRQWLGILHGQWREAGWSMSIWPDWVASDTIPPTLPAPALH